jgi:hypothetical protein
VRNLREELTYAAAPRRPAPPRHPAAPRHLAARPRPPALPRPATRPRRAATAPHRPAAVPVPPPHGMRPCAKKHSTKRDSARKPRATRRSGSKRARAGTRRARPMVPVRAGGPGRRADPAGPTPGATGTWSSWPATSPGSCGRRQPTPRR